MYGPIENVRFFDKYFCSDGILSNSFRRIVHFAELPYKFNIDFNSIWNRYEL